MALLVFIRGPDVAFVASNQKHRCWTALGLRDTLPLRSDSAKAVIETVPSQGRMSLAKIRPICNSLEGSPGNKTAAKEFSTVALGFHFSLDEKKWTSFQRSIF
jgi:hypothetical protein